MEIEKGENKTVNMEEQKGINMRINEVEKNKK